MLALAAQPIFGLCLLSGPWASRSQNSATQECFESSRIIRQSRGGMLAAAADESVETEGALARSSSESDGLKSMSDEGLLAAYIRGERSAFQLLLARYRDELLHFLTRFLGSRAAGEDVFQETFLQVHMSAATFDPARRFKPWLFTIAANKARDYHRKHKKRPMVSLSNAIGDSEGQRFVDLLEADLPSAQERIADAERSRLVRDVIDSMPLHLREILLMSYFQRLSYNQIADSLEIPLGTVKSRLHTAVAAFARLWKATRAESQKGSRDSTSSSTDPLDSSLND
jgi:RNA polymerase sigma-70 factor (ECF subfamily)